MNPKPYTRAAALPAILAQRIAIIDGAMGTMIQRYKLGEADFRGARFKDHGKDLKGNNDMLQLTRPDVITEIHEQYLAAGADLVETNTFGATSVAQGDYGLGQASRDETERGRRQAGARRLRQVQHARQAALRGRRAGPHAAHRQHQPRRERPRRRATSASKQLRAAYLEQASGLLEGGCDVFLVETIFDTLNAKAALFALDELMESTGERLPVIISGTVTDASGASCPARRWVPSGIRCAMRARWRWA